MSLLRFLNLKSMGKTSQISQAFELDQQIDNFGKQLSAAQSHHRNCGTQKRKTMNFTIQIEGSVPLKILVKANRIVESGKIRWRKTQRDRRLKSCRITDCFRLIKMSDSSILLLMDHKHYNRYLSA